MSHRLTRFDFDTMSLPAELIDHIFSFLQEDTLALKACSKAHPLLSRLAERHLFAHIIIDPSRYLRSNVTEATNPIFENPRFLDYPRTLEIGACLYASRNLPVISIMSMIPQMTNLISLTIHDPYQTEGFISTLRNCLPQSPFQQLCLSNLYGFPFSILDDAKNIKQLTLYNCRASDEPISTSPPSQLSLETLVLVGRFDPGLHRWAMRWVTRLTTLELRDLPLDLDRTAFPQLLEACSNSLTRLYLDIGDYCM